MEVKSIFNDMTLVDSNANALPFFDEFCKIVCRLGLECGIRHVLFDRACPLVSFRQYLLDRKEEIEALIGVYRYNRIKELFTHFLIPSTPYGTHNVSIFNCDHCSESVCWAMENGFLLVGLDSSEQWHQLLHRGVLHDSSEIRRPISMMCVTNELHMNEAPFIRWAFAKGILSFGHVVAMMSEHGYKHYKLQGQSGLPINNNASWVLGTAHPSPSQFSPGLVCNGLEMQELLRKVFDAAMLQGRLNWDELDKFEYDHDVVIGASNGRLTRKVTLYVTDHDEFHIRPS